MAASKKKIGNLARKGVSKAKAEKVKGGNVSRTRAEISMTFARNARA
jgi:hypothetical protein